MGGTTVRDIGKRRADGAVADLTRIVPGGPRGAVCDTSSTSSPISCASTGFDVTGTTPGWSFFALFRPSTNVNATHDCLFCHVDAATTLGVGFFRYYESAAGPYQNGALGAVRYRTGGAGFDAIYSAAGTCLVNQLYGFAVTYDGATMRQFINGVATGSVASTAGIGTFTATQQLCNWYSSPVVNRKFRGQMFDIRLWNRPLARAEVSSLARDPWAMYRTPRSALGKAPSFFWRSALLSRRATR
jgi:hypothetical protein